MALQNGGRLSQLSKCRERRVSGCESLANRSECNESVRRGIGQGWDGGHGDIDELRCVGPVGRIKVVVPPRVRDKEAAHGDDLGGSQVHDGVATHAPRERGLRVGVLRKIEDDLLANEKFGGGTVLHVGEFARGVSAPRVRIDRTIRRREFPRTL